MHEISASADAACHCIVMDSCHRRPPTITDSSATHPPQGFLQYVKLKDVHVDPCTKLIDAARANKLVPLDGSLAPAGRERASPDSVRSFDLQILPVDSAEERARANPA